MSTYFVTGATGFIGRRLVEGLLLRPDCDHVFALVRPRSAGKLGELADHDKLTTVPGDLTDRIDAEPVDHVVHLGAVYDLTAPDDLQHAVNVEGTRNVLDYAARTGAKLVHHVSSIAVAGDHRGVFREDDFDLGQQHPSAYHATKFAAEKLVRAHTGRWRVYRPAVVVGDSRTGAIDKVDGPYHFFPTIAALAKLPRRLPLVAPHLGATNVVPVDYVVDALDRLIHADVPDGSTFHLTAPRAQAVTEVYNALAAAAGAPKVLASLLPLPVPPAPTNAILAAVLGELGIPPQVLPHLALHAEFDSTAARRATGLEPPPPTDYAATLWRYWAEHLDPLRAARRHGLAGRTVLVTGASSGIGRATALAVAEKGATVLLVARRGDELDGLAERIRGNGGTAHAHPCDLTDAEAVDALLKQVLAEHDVDMLVNNAGRSIRRSVHLSVDRLHDYERTMALNYFAPLRLILGLLPHMRERRFGHVVNISTMGVQVNTPRFSAYLASKSALDAFSRVAASETVADGVTFTSVRMPLVRTPMIGPTEVYDAFPAATPERAAQWVVRALERRPEEVNLPLGVLLELARKVAPKTMRSLMHLGYRAMPEKGGHHGPPLASVAAGVTRLALRALR